MVGERIGLGALSARQRKLVEHHVPLVRYTIRRLPHLCGRQRIGREPWELMQEGVIALAEAVRSHDPARHGGFAAYAMARIHFAVSRFICENASCVRVPFITQRKRRVRRPTGDETWAPRVYRIDERELEAKEMHPGLDSDTNRSPSEGGTIGDLIRARHDAAMARVIREMKHSPHRPENRRRLVRHLSRERWSIPEPNEKTPIRQLARRLGCAQTNVARCDAQYRLRMAAVLSEDEAFMALRALAKRRRRGLRHRLSEREMREMRGSDENGE